jgi:Ammonium Transporter Family
MGQLRFFPWVKRTTCLINTTTMTIYDTCAEANGDNVLLVVQCVANWIETNSTNVDTTKRNYVEVNDLTKWLLILTGAMVFFMQAGFAMVCAGAIRKKNVNNTVSLFIEIHFEALLPQFVIKSNRRVLLPLTY